MSLLTLEKHEIENISAMLAQLDTQINQEDLTDEFVALGCMLTCSNTCDSSCEGGCGGSCTGGCSGSVTIG